MSVVVGGRGRGSEVRRRPEGTRPRETGSGTKGGKAQGGGSHGGGGDFAPQGTGAVFGDIFGCHNWVGGVVIGI